MNPNKVYEGTLKKWDPQRGFGFVTCSAFARDVFLHFSKLKAVGQYDPTSPPAVDSRFIFKVIEVPGVGVQVSELLTEKDLAQSVEEPESVSESSPPISTHSNGFRYLREIVAELAYEGWRTSQIKTKDTLHGLVSFWADRTFFNECSNQEMNQMYRHAESLARLD